MSVINFESQWAHEIQDPALKQKIRKEYQQRWAKPIPDPNSHPWQYDPFDPPMGWKYDAYYEMWIKQ
jgi:hypothetical protein